MRYKIGDKVRVREDLVVNKSYGIDTFVDNMEKFKGKVVTISEITSRTKEEYHIKEDREKYFWTAEMFETDAENAPVNYPSHYATGKIETDAENDPVSHPSHYTDGRIEVIDFIQDKKLDFCRGNIVKYVARAGKKGDKAKEIEDLKKARQYCEFAINQLEGRV